MQKYDALDLLNFFLIVKVNAATIIQDFSCNVYK